MILAYAIILLVILAILFRRDLSALGQIPYRGGWLSAGGVISLFFLQAALVLYAPGQTIWQMVILNLSQIALIFLFLLNRHVPGAKLFAVGIALNVLVMLANGGWMPVTPETAHFVHPDQVIVEQTRPVSSKNIILPRTETNLWILSDIIRITLPWRRNAMSIGDVLLIVAVAQFIFQTTAKKRDKLLVNQV
ncbi:MAG: DUF5317 domain-containing protein [Chloroflexi bacterium]|nr:DUF5317 domain-containing protein [Chloroflexota bacterium]